MTWIRTWLPGLMMLALALAGAFAMAPAAQAAPAPVASAEQRILAPSQTGELDEQEIADLLWMREEEKLARDVYLALADTWNLQVFTNISRSEQQHMDTMLSLINTYGLEDPVGDNPQGVFTNPDLQALHDQLLAQGKTSQIEALRVGATIEEVDIVDLERAIADTDNPDVVQAYYNLMCGSENHLRAFVRNLAQQGETYTPQYLDQARYDEIMAGTTGSCGPQLTYKTYMAFFLQ